MVIFLCPEIAWCVPAEVQPIFPVLYYVGPIQVSQRTGLLKLHFIEQTPVGVVNETKPESVWKSK